MRKRRKKNKQKHQEVFTMIGSIIDLPIDEFKEELKNQRVNIGVANNLRLHLIGEYERCKIMIQDLQNSILNGSLNESDPEVQKSYVGLYVQMQKIEDKVNYIVEYVQHLSEGL